MTSSFLDEKSDIATLLEETGKLTRYACVLTRYAQTKKELWALEKEIFEFKNSKRIDCRCQDPLNNENSLSNGESLSNGGSLSNIDASQYDPPP